MNDQELAGLPAEVQLADANARKLARTLPPDQRVVFETLIDGILDLARQKLALVRENAELRADRDLCLAMRDKYMAELAAVNRRIAEAPIVLCEVKPEDETEDSGTFYLPRHLWNMTLALLPVGGETK